MKMREKWAAKRREIEGIELPDEPVTRERFSVQIEQNHSTAGLGATGLMKWRFSVVDTANGRLQKSDYALTANQAQMMGNQYVTKILSGKRPVK